MIHEFAEDNVKYLELRTTPREVASTGMTKESYIEAVLKAIDDCARENVDSIVRLLLAIDRRNSVEVARNTIDLAEKYAKLSNGVVVGIDLSGDPQVGVYKHDLILGHEKKQVRGVFDGNLGIIIIFIFDQIIIKVAGNQDRHKSSVEFDFGPNQTTHFGVTCPWVTKISYFQLEYLWSQLASLDQILCVASLGCGKGCIWFWGRLDQNSGFHDNRKPPLTYNGENDISTFSPHLTLAHWTQVSDRCPLGCLYF